jgi:hypothetical protein
MPANLGDDDRGAEKLFETGPLPVMNGQWHENCLFVYLALMNDAFDPRLFDRDSTDSGIFSDDVALGKATGQLIMQAVLGGVVKPLIGSLSRRSLDFRPLSKAFTWA